MDIIMLILAWLKEYKDAIEVITLVPAASWALWIYHGSNKKEAAEWLDRLFKGFYTDSEFRRLRMQLEYDKKIRLAIKKVLPAPPPETDENEQQLLSDLDAILNYFELILHLEGTGQLKKTDRNQVFKYWFDLFREPQREYLRRYLKRYEYKALCGTLPQYVAFYGLLMSEDTRTKEGVRPDQLKLVGKCEIQGDLHALGAYPGLVEGKCIAHGELYKIEDQSVFATLDRFERFDPESVRESEFVRKSARLKHPRWPLVTGTCRFKPYEIVWRSIVQVCRPKRPEVDCWVYIYNKGVSPETKIKSGSWIE